MRVMIIRHARHRTYRAGSAIEDYCRACKSDRMHTVIAADGAGTPLRVTCGSAAASMRTGDHVRRRREPSVDVSASRSSPSPPPREPRAPFPLVGDRERAIARYHAAGGSHGRSRAVAAPHHSRESGLTVAVRPTNGGRDAVLRPATPAFRRNRGPSSFFHKIVMLRNRLRTLEQQVNASDLPDDVKVNCKAT